MRISSDPPKSAAADFAELGVAPAGLGSPEWGGFDRGRTRGSGLRDDWRSFRTAARLGWQMEANWTDPFLFFIYSVAKPLAAALILVAMTFIFLFAARWMLRVLERMARQEGRLSVRWQ